MTCVRKPNWVPVLSLQVDINPLDNESVDLESDLDAGNGLVSESQHESRMSESSIQDPSESVADSVDQILEHGQSVDDSVSTFNHSAGAESLAIPTPVPAPRRSTIGPELGVIYIWILCSS